MVTWDEAKERTYVESWLPEEFQTVIREQVYPHLPLTEKRLEELSDDSREIREAFYNTEMMLRSERSES